MKTKHKLSKVHLKDKQKWASQPDIRMQTDTTSHNLKFDLKEYNLRTILEVQSKNTNNELRENAFAQFKQRKNDIELNIVTSTLLSPSTHSIKISNTNAKTYNVLFLIVVRVFLSIVVLLLFGYNLLTSHIEYSIDDYPE